MHVGLIYLHMWHIHVHEYMHMLTCMWRLQGGVRTSSWVLVPPDSLRQGLSVRLRASSYNLLASLLWESSVAQISVSSTFVCHSYWFQGPKLWASCFHNCDFNRWAISQSQDCNFNRIGSAYFMRIWYLMRDFMKRLQLLMEIARGRRFYQRQWLGIRSQTTAGMQHLKNARAASLSRLYLFSGCSSVAVSMGLDISITTLGLSSHDDSHENCLLWECGGHETQESLTRPPMDPCQAFPSLRF